MENTEAKVPTIVSTAIICLLIGVELGVAGMAIFGNVAVPFSKTATSDASASAGPAGGPMPPMGGPGGAPGGGMGMPGGGMSTGHCVKNEDGSYSMQ